MDVAARMTSKGQITVPKAVREALGLREGDQVLFRLDNGRATLARSADLLELAGSVATPPELVGAPWEEIRRRADEARARAWADEERRSTDGKRT